jgi:hypothetical protein
LLVDLKHRVSTVLKTAAWGGVAIVAGLISLLFFCIAVFIWTADAYGPTMAAVALGAAFLAIAIAAFTACAVIRRRQELARQRAAQAQAQWWLDPKVMLTAAQVARVVGIRRFIPIVLIGSVVAGLLLGRSNRSSHQPHDDT